MAYFLLVPAAPDFILSVPKCSKKNIIEDAEVNQRSWLEESGHWLENVDVTRLVLASGKPVQQKTTRLGEA